MENFTIIVSAMAVATKTVEVEAKCFDDALAIALKPETYNSQGDWSYSEVEKDTVTGWMD